MNDGEISQLFHSLGFCSNCDFVYFYFDYYPCDKQRYCNRVLDFSSVNNLRQDGQMCWNGKFQTVSILGNSKKTSCI